MPSESKKETWCIWSTAKTINSGQFSLESFFETLLAITIYCRIALYVDTYTWLIASWLIAPLLLLRSQPAVDLALDMFLPHENRQPDTSYKSWQVWVCLCTVFLASAGMAHLYADHFVTGSWQWDLLQGVLLVAVSTFAGMTLGGAIGVVVAGAPILTGRMPWAKQITEFVLGEDAVVRASEAALNTYGGNARRLEAEGRSYGRSAIAASFVGVILGSSLAEQSSLALSMWLAIVMIVEFSIRLDFLLGMCAAISLVLGSLVIRLVATARYVFWRGLAALPENWFRVAFVEGLFTFELLPNIGTRNKRLTLAGIWNAERSGKNAFVRCVLYPSLVLAYFAPPVVYRFSLKSTLWLYYPLVYIVTRTEKNTDWLVILSRTIKARIRAFVACATFLALFWKSLAVKNGFLLLNAKVITPLALFWAIDINQLRPWDWISLSSAVLTMLLFIWADSLYHQRDELRKNRGNVQEFRVLSLKGIAVIVGIRNILTVGYLLISVAFVLLLFTDVEAYLPLPILSWVGSFFESDMPMEP